MNNNVATLTCDECNREMAKAQRLHEGRRYCAICYARIFKRRLCPKCGNLARLPKSDGHAVCKKCETDKPCIRCKKTEYEVGKITPYGPVCNSCAPHFREPKPCGLCSKLSSRLTRVTRAGIELPVCPKCASRDHGTCQSCRRHRLLAEAQDGRMLCSTCLEQGEILCLSCDKPMPAGYGKTCEACYWLETFRKRLRIDQAAFSMQGMNEVFGEFGEWLLNEVGGQKSALSIHRYLPFFLEMERQWRCMPTYLELLKHFGAEGLRRVRLPMRWLEETKAVVADSIAREEDSNRRRIDAIMASLPAGTLGARTLISYRDRLMERVDAGKTTLHSMRLALRPAVSLFLKVDATGVKLPNQTELDRYLLEAPGQRAAISGFINFLNEKHNLELIPIVNNEHVSKSRRRKMEAELMALMKSGGEGEEFRRKWLSVALAYFHGLPRSTAGKLRENQIAIHENGSLSVVLNNTEYWVPQWGSSTM